MKDAKKCYDYDRNCQGVSLVSKLTRTARTFFKNPKNKPNVYIKVLAEEYQIIKTPI
jgi:hypothetical protein